MRLARSQPELPGKRLFPAAVAWASRTFLDPARPAILTHKDEGVSGNVTGPDGDGSGEGPVTTGGPKAGRRSIVRALPRVRQVDAAGEDLQ